MKIASAFSIAGIVLTYVANASVLQLRQQSTLYSRSNDIQDRYTELAGQYDNFENDFQSLRHKLIGQYLQKRVFIAGAEDGPKELGLESQAYDPVKNLADRKKESEALADRIRNDKGSTWTKDKNGKWVGGDNIPKDSQKSETIKELPGIVPGTKGAKEFEDRWNNKKNAGNLNKDDPNDPKNQKLRYQKSMPGPDAMSDQAVNNYSKKLYEDGNKKAKEQGMTKDSNMAATQFSQKPTTVEHAKNSDGSFKKDSKGRYIPGPNDNRQKDTKSPIDMSLTGVGSGKPPYSKEYQTGVDKETARQKEDAQKQKEISDRKHGGKEGKEKWDKDPKTGKKTKADPNKAPEECSHTTGGNCAEKGTLPKANKDANNQPAPGSVSGAYGKASPRPGYKSDPMNNDPRGNDPGLVGAHPGCSGKDPKIGCDKVLDANKVKDINGQSPGTQDAKNTIPKGNTAEKAKQLADKMGTKVEDKKQSHKTNRDGKPVEHKFPSADKDKNGKPVEKKAKDWVLPPNKKYDQLTPKEQAAHEVERDKKGQAIEETKRLAVEREKQQAEAKNKKNDKKPEKDAGGNTDKKGPISTNRRNREQKNEQKKKQNDQKRAQGMEKKAKKDEATRLIQEHRQAQAKSNSKLLNEKQAKEEVQKSKDEAKRLGKEDRKATQNKESTKKKEQNKKPKDNSSVKKQERKDKGEKKVTQPKSQKNKEKSRTKQEAKQSKLCNRSDGCVPQKESKAKESNKAKNKQTPKADQNKQSKAQDKSNNLPKTGNKSKTNSQPQKTSQQKNNQGKANNKQPKQNSQPKTNNQQSKQNNQQPKTNNQSKTNKQPKSNNQQPKQNNQPKSNNQSKTNSQQPKTNNQQPKQTNQQQKTSNNQPKVKDQPKANNKPTSKTNEKAATAAPAPKSKTPDPPKAAPPKPKEQPKAKTTTSSKKGKRDVAMLDEDEIILISRAEFMQAVLMALKRRSLMMRKRDFLDEYIWM